MKITENMITNKVSPNFDKGIAEGTLTKNGKKKLIQNLKWFNKITSHSQIAFYRNGFTAVGKLKNMSIKGKHYNDYIIFDTETSKNHSKLLFDCNYYQRSEINHIQMCINNLLKKTREEQAEYDN